MTAAPSEDAMHRRAESRGLRLKKLTRRWQGDRYMLIDVASGVVVRKDLGVDELADVLAAY